MFGLFNLVAAVESATTVAGLANDKKNKENFENNVGKSGMKLMVLGLY